MTRALQSDKYGTTLWIEREAAGMDPMQLWRELVQNGAEAGATDILIDGWSDPETGFKLARHTDNGHGLTEAQLIKHMETLHLTGKSTGKNYGIGARIAALPHNPAGMVLASRTNAGDAMVKLWKDSGVYGLVDWDVIDDEGYAIKTSAVLPDAGELARVSDDRSGTAVILHGDGKHDTWDASIAYKVHKFLAGRYYVFPNDVTVRVARWGHDPVQATGEVLATVAEADGEVPFKNVAGLNGVMFWWTLPLSDETRKAVPAQNMVTGGAGVVVEDEIFHYSRSYLGDFGVIYQSVQARVAILIWIDGSTMDSSRAGVVVPSTDRKSIPWKKLGAHFAAHMPTEIDALLSKVTTSSTGFDEKLAKLLDEDWMKHLKPTPVAVKADNGDLKTGDDPGDALPPKGESPGEPGTRSYVSTGKDATHKKSDGTKPAKTKPKIVTPTVEFVDATQVGGIGIEYFENTNHVLVSIELPPYVREVERWIETTGHPKQLIEKAVQLGYKSELAGAIIDANGMQRYGIAPETVVELKSPTALFAKTLGMQSLTARIEQFIKDEVKAA